MTAIILLNRKLFAPNFSLRRKLTSSQITLNSNPKDTDGRKETISYEEPNVAPNDAQTAGDDLYNPSVQHRDELYETFADVRRKTLILAEENNIYSEDYRLKDYPTFHNPNVQLYHSHDGMVYGIGNEVDGLNLAFHAFPLSQPQRHEEQDQANKLGDDATDPKGVSSSKPSQPGREFGDKEVTCNTRAKDVDHNEELQFEDKKTANNPRDHDVDFINDALPDPSDKEYVLDADIYKLLEQGMDTAGIPLEEVRLDDAYEDLFSIEARDQDVEPASHFLPPP